MMPNWLCENCGLELWGWAPCHAEDTMPRNCPECGGELACSNQSPRKNGSDESAA